MDTEMRKRLGEAAKKFGEIYLENLNKVREIKGKQPLSADVALIDLCLDVAELSFSEGGEWMFKECGGMTVLHDMRRLILAQCKEWMEINTEEYAIIIDGKEYIERNQILADFESDMNKLWEEKK